LFRNRSRRGLKILIQPPDFLEALVYPDDMKYTIIFCFILLVISCTEESERRFYHEHVKTIYVDLNNVSDELKMSDFFSGISYMPLRTPDGKPIGRIRKILVHDKYLGFYDEAAKRVWVYSKNGRYVNNILIPEGRGPGEITHLTDVILCDNDLIHALGAFKIVVYNLEGEFIREVNFDFFIYGFTYLEDEELYVGYSGNSLNTQISNRHSGNNLFFFDNNGEIKNSEVPIPEGREQMRFMVSNKFPSYNNIKKFYPHLSDTVYSINPDEVVPRYVLNYQEHSIPEEVFSRREQYSRIPHEWVEFREKELIENDYVLNLFYFNETSRFIHFRIGTGSSQYNIFHDKVTGETKVGPRRLTNDIDYAYVPFIYESSDESLYTIIEAGDLIRELNRIYGNEPQLYAHPNTQHLVNLANSLKEDSNPVLQILHFKE
jgi:hypothetical protein